MKRFLRSIWCLLAHGHSPRSRTGHRQGTALFFTYWLCRRCGHTWTRTELMPWKKR